MENHRISTIPAHRYQTLCGPRKLPELGRSLGKSINEFKRASNELRNSLEEEIRVDEQKEASRKAAEAAQVPAAAAPVVDGTEPRTPAAGA